MKTSTIEASFILGFGVFHFAIPFLFPPNVNEINLFGLQISDFILPGCFILAALSIIFCLTKNRYPAAVLTLLFGGGITFHALYLSGLLPSVLVVSTPLILVGGIILDGLSIIAIYDYYRRVQAFSSVSN